MKKVSEEIYEPRLLLKFEIPFLPPSMNLFYAGTNHHRRSRIARVWHDAVVLIMRQGKAQPFTEKVWLTTQCHFKKGQRAFDPSNCFTANKLGEDGLVIAGILKNDSRLWVAGHSLIAPVVDADESKTVIWVECRKEEAK